MVTLVNIVLGMLNERFELKEKQVKFLIELSKSYNDNLLSLEKLNSEIEKKSDNSEDFNFIKLQCNYSETLKFNMENIFMKEILLGFKNFNNTIIKMTMLDDLEYEYYKLSCLNCKINNIGKNKIHKKISFACQRRLGERISKLNHQIIETSNILIDNKETELFNWDQVEKELDSYNY